MSPENSKPEWFQMADADPMPATPKSKRGIRMMALATPLLVLGAGLAYAQTQGTSPADAGTTAQAAANPIAIASTASVATPTTPVASTPVASTPAAPESSAPKASSHDASTPAATTVLVSDATSAPTPITPIAPATTITKPGLTMPTGGGDDDGQEGSSDDD